MARVLRAAGVLGVVLWVAGCQPPPVTDVCAGVACGSGRCVVDQGAAACLCDADFRPEGLTCVPRVVVVDPCAANPCAGLSTSVCIADAGVASCECPGGRVDIDGVCVVRTACTPNPCTQWARLTVCEVVNGAARCSCQPGYAPEGEGCAATPTWDCATQHTGPDEDAAEPNECPTQAWQLVGGAPADAFNLRPAGDHDWFSLPTVTGHVYLVTAEATGGARTLLLEVFDAAGVTQLAADSHADGSAEVHFRAPNRGPAMARVRGLRTSDVSTYVIRYEDLGLDDYANLADEAVTLAPGAAFDGQLQYPGDLDLVWLELPSATAVRIDMTGNDGGALPDVVVDLVRSDGGPARTLSYERTVLTVPADDALLLVARGRNLVDVGPFTVGTADLGVDDHADDRAFATPIQPSATTRSAVFERESDLDSMTFKQVGGHIYQARCTLAPGSYSTCSSTARTSGGALLGVDLYGSSQAPVWLAATTEAVTVTFGDVGFSPLQTRPYTWLVEDLGVDDHPNPPGPGTPITGGTPVAGRLELPDDADSFSFTAVANHVMAVTATASGSSAQLRVEIQTSSGQVLAQGTGSVAALVPVTSTYRAVVRRDYLYSSGVLPYTLVVGDLGVDDHGNDRTTATPLTLAQPTSGELQYAADVDAFSITLTGDHVYRANCVTAAGTCNLSVVDAAGSALGSSYSVPRTFLAPQNGTAYLLVNASYGSPTGAFTVTVTDLGVEDHGATSGTATPYPTLGAAAAGELLFQGDVDVFSFSATAGRIYQASCTPSLGATCPVQVANAAGTIIASSNYPATSVRALAASSGTLYVSVGVNSYSTFSYTLTVTDVGTDDHGNSAATATPIVVGTPVTGEVQYQQDVDSLALTSVARHLYRVTCAATVGGCALTIRSGTTSLTSVYEAATVTATVKAPGAALTIDVMSGRTSTWSVSVEDLGLEDHGDTVATATALSLGAPATPGSVEVSGDVDVFTLAGVATNDLVRFVCAAPTGACQLAVRDPVGTLVASSYSGTGASAVDVGVRAATAGTYSVEVTAGYSSTVPTYTIRAEAGTDDHGDTFATATVIPALGQAMSGLLNFSNDVDVFAITLPAGPQRTVQLLGTGVRGAVRGPGGAYLTYVYSNDTRTFFTSVAGTYWVEVSRDYTQSGPYSLTIL